MSKVNRLSVRDIATIGIFSVLVQIIQVALGIVASPFILYSFVFFTGPIALICAPIYMLMAHKVGKPGVLLIFNIIRGLLFVVFGAPVLMIWFLIGGLLSEVIMYGKGSYNNFYRNTIGWIFSSIIYSLHLVFMYILFQPVFGSMIGEETLNVVSNYLSSPLWIIITLITVTLCALIGCIVSNRLMNKHFKRSGIIQ